MFPLGLVEISISIVLFKLTITVKDLMWQLFINWSFPKGQNDVFKMLTLFDQLAQKIFK